MLNEQSFILAFDVSFVYCIVPLLGKPQFTETDEFSEKFQGWAMFTFLNNAIFLTIQCFPILNDAIFRRCSEKNIGLDVFDDV